MSATSVAAYRVVRPTARETRVKILDFAMKRGVRGFTCDELAEAWACAHNHTSQRVHELLKSGLLVSTGRTRPTRAGHAARVLIAHQFAHPAKDVTASPADSLFGSLSLGRHPD
jgi:predicted transcriptional regulator